MSRIDHRLQISSPSSQAAVDNSQITYHKECKYVHQITSRPRRKFPSANNLESNENWQNV